MDMWTAILHRTKTVIRATTVSTRRGANVVSSAVIRVAKAAGRGAGRGAAAVYRAVAVMARAAGAGGWSVVQCLIQCAAGVWRHGRPWLVAGARGVVAATGRVWGATGRGAATTRRGITGTCSAGWAAGVWGASAVRHRLRHRRRRRGGFDDLTATDMALLVGVGVESGQDEVKDSRPRRDRKAGVGVPPRRGISRPFHGRAPLAPAVPVYRASTSQLQGLYPFLYGQSLPAVGPPIGIDCLAGGTIAGHPIEWLRRGMITNPNILVTGMPGTGKSATVKALALRLMAYGVKTIIPGDVKNEYARLARAVGVEPVEIGPGLAARVNPLDADPLGMRAGDTADDDWRGEIHRRRLTLLSSLITMRLERDLTPTEESALSGAIRIASGEADAATVLADPTIPDVWRVLCDMPPDLVSELRATVDHAQEMIRPVADALGTMISGSLSGLFDAPTTVGLDFNAPIQTVDLSRLNRRGDKTVAMMMACVSTWAQAAIDSSHTGPVRMVVHDELWRAMRIPALVKKLDADLRLSRSLGTIQMLCTHRLADFEAVGDAGSAEVSIARSLIGSCDVRVCFAQDTAPLKMTRDVIGLSDVESHHIGSWSAEQLGRALWKIGRSNSQITHTILTPAEMDLFWTNERMEV